MLLIVLFCGSGSGNGSSINSDSGVVVAIVVVSSTVVVAGDTIQEARRGPFSDTSPCCTLYQDIFRYQHRQ